VKKERGGRRGVNDEWNRRSLEGGRVGVEVMCSVHCGQTRGAKF